MREMIKYTLVMIDSSNNPDFRKMANRHQLTQITKLRLMVCGLSGRFAIDYKA